MSVVGAESVDNVPGFNCADFAPLSDHLLGTKKNKRPRKIRKRRRAKDEAIEQRSPLVLRVSACDEYHSLSIRKTTSLLYNEAAGRANLLNGQECLTRARSFLEIHFLATSREKKRNETERTC